MFNASNTYYFKRNKIKLKLKTIQQALCNYRYVRIIGGCCNKGPRLGDNFNMTIGRIGNNTPIHFDYYQARKPM